ncbi:MAG TPA: lauroyl acyltransferase [Stellaceae bacterium]|nr:lauroyl acyltransferase [Stellaceae bacterium]
MSDPPLVAADEENSSLLPGPSPWISALRAAARHLAHAGEAAGLFAVMAVFACLPVGLASAIGGFLGRNIGPRLRASRGARRNLGRALPGNSESDNERILRAMWDNLGRAVAENPHLRRICAEGSGRVEIINGEAIAALLAAGRPSLLFGGHFANWEVGPTTIHRIMGSALLSVYRAANNPWVDRLQRRGLRTRLAVAKGAQGGRELIRHLRRGGHVAMLVDQKLNDGIAVPFFGRDAMTAPAIARLAQQFDCPIVPVRVERLGGARFRFTVEPSFTVADSGNAVGDVQATMARVNAVIEAWVRARPEQWLWLHRRWPD